MTNTVIENTRNACVVEVQENEKKIRNMVMESYRDMLAGKGRDYKIFFEELESRYRSANL